MMMQTLQVSTIVLLISLKVSKTAGQEVVVPGCKCPANECYPDTGSSDNIFLCELFLSAKYSKDENYANSTTPLCDSLGEDENWGLTTRIAPGTCQDAISNLSSCLVYDSPSPVATTYVRTPLLGCSGFNVFETSPEGQIFSLAFDFKCTDLPDGVRRRFEVGLVTALGTINSDDQGIDVCRDEDDDPINLFWSSDDWIEGKSGTRYVCREFQGQLNIPVYHMLAMSVGVDGVCPPHQMTTDDVPMASDSSDGSMLLQVGHHHLSTTMCLLVMVVWTGSLLWQT